MNLRGRPVVYSALIFILAVYGMARVLEVAASRHPSTALVALDVLAALAFCLVDGARRFGLRALLVFLGACVVIGNISENLSIATGFPFGHYHFLDLMGPKLFRVPVLLGLAYVGMAYVSWVVASVILRGGGQRSGLRAILLPVAAGFVMVGWDLAQDPVWSTILHAWQWHDGGPWFGVPVSNYMGWFGTVCLIFLAFAAYLRRAGIAVAGNDALPAWPAVGFYSICAAGNVLQVFSHPATETVRDATGRTWSRDGILLASALVSLFVMGAFAAMAGARLVQKRLRACLETVRVEGDGLDRLRKNAPNEMF